jgi:hypothetical protein
MTSSDAVDVTTDFQEDSRGRDPDLYSSLLQEFHRRLWSKPLPSGALFTLTPDRVGSVRVLQYQGLGRDFVLSSDTLANSNRGRLREFYDAMGAEPNVAWHHHGGTIGGRLIFPRNRVDGKQTINQRRGTHPRIRDRFDLTLESIRRHYAGEDSPLSDVLARYGEFFALFIDFRSYVDFFLLQDLVDDDGAIRFYLPFRGFDAAPLPGTLGDYRQFRQSQLEFVTSRNARILDATAWPEQGAP